MKKLIGYAFLCLPAQELLAQPGKKFNDTTYLQPVEVQAIRAAATAPFAKTNLTKKDLEKNNLGQDLPFLLNQTPSVVVNSDAGNGIGYTGIRIRGIDATRINVTLNGIPYNDAESQGTFFVDLPDISSSVNSIQIQRGVGTSTNGSGAFGSSINLATNEVNSKAYLDFNNSFGSFNSMRNTLQFGTGMLANHFSIDGRLSNIQSDGYIDRARTRLQSAYLSLAWVQKNNSIRFNLFSGKEKTYQAWNGVPEYLLDSARTYNSSGTEKPGSPYDNETDNYIQTHYQLFFNHQFNDYWKANLAIFFTKGRGYYEQYKHDQELAAYGLPNYQDGSTLVTQTDLVRRLWLDNDFYGTIYSLQYKKHNTQFILGGGWNGYSGNHYGEITWAAVQAAIPVHYQWYNLNAYKNDLSTYAKWMQNWGSRWKGFADLQFRNVAYSLHGFKDNPDLLIRKNYNFFNPKLGITYQHQGWKAYASIAMAGKEPIRDDFEAGALQQPRPEYLTDVELGMERQQKKYSWGANFYYMQYRDQLVLTGKINDVGAYTRTNIPHSYRAGIELYAQAKPSSRWELEGNITLSANKIKNYTEYLGDYDNGGQQTKFYSSTDISFSPSLTGSTTISYHPFAGAQISSISKYVGRQYLDNSSLASRSLHAYYVQDMRLSYNWNHKHSKATSFILQLNNIFNTRYEPNGYSFSYVYGGKQTTENFYFPMAGFNFMLGVGVGLGRK
jgi:iron complex outermembrane receptor protein